MNTKLFISHILITLISFTGMSIIWVNIENDTLEFVFRIASLILIFSLYILSGYLSTNNESKVNLIKYTIIAVIGIMLWMFCFIISPNDLNWQGRESGVWLFYIIYTFGILEPSDWIFKIFKIPEINNTNISLLFLLILSIIPSLLQYIGGIIKKNNITTKNIA